MRPQVDGWDLVINLLTAIALGCGIAVLGGLVLVAFVLWVVETFVW